MKYKDLILQIVKDVLEEYIAPTEKDTPIKTSETPQEMTPLEREKARRRKIASKYDSYIIGKLLPSLNK